MFLGNHYVLHTRAVLACYYFLEESPATISFLNFSILLVSLSVMHGTRVIWLCLAACNCSSNFWLFLPSAAALCLLSSCCFFFAKSPLSSPLLYLPMIKLSKSIHYMEYELMIKNLWGTWYHYQPPLHYLLLSSLLWCLDAPSSWSNDD